MSTIDQLLAFCDERTCKNLAIVGETDVCHEMARVSEPHFASIKVISDLHETALAVDDASESGDGDVLILVEPDVRLVEEAFSQVRPYCRIVVIGPVKNGKSDINFYQTVHSKNLEVKFLRRGQ